MSHVQRQDEVKMLGTEQDSGIVNTVLKACFGAIAAMAGVLAKVFYARNVKCDELEKKNEKLDEKISSLEKENGELRTEIAVLKQRHGE